MSRASKLAAARGAAHRARHSTNVAREKLERRTNELDALRAQVAALEQDAARYRWLRDTHGVWFPPTNDWFGGELCDEAIDAELSGKGGAE